jgi:endonuclease/exonuclease/phosphatase family metal-dependent hydrolase
MKPTRVRLATYNIHKARGMDGRTRPNRIAEVLRQVDADVIALQEVLSFGRTGHVDQAHYFGHELGYTTVVGENRKHRGAAYGNVVLSRLPVIGSCNYDVSVPGREERGCLRTDIDLGHKAILHLFNVHLGTAYMERRHQARRLLEEELIRSEKLNGPRVVLGDFNEWVRGLVSRLLTAEFESADLRLHLGKRRTYPGFFPFMHLDHIYFDHSLKLVNVCLHKSPTAMIASDHLPLVADFTF